MSHLLEQVLNVPAPFARLLLLHRVRLESAQQFLRERGGWAVLLGRFTAFLRAMTPALAGASRMPYPRFLAFNVTGGLIWGVGVTLLGYFAESSYAKVEQSLGRTSAGLVLILVVAGVFLWSRRRKHARAKITTDAESG